MAYTSIYLRYPSIIMSNTCRIRLTSSNTTPSPVDAGQYIYTLTQPLYNPKNLEVQLVSGQLNNSVFNCTSSLNNDNFTVYFPPVSGGSGGGYTVNLAVADGLYSPASLCAAFQSACSAAGLYMTQTTSGVSTVVYFASLTFTSTGRAYTVLNVPVPTSQGTSNGTTTTVKNTSLPLSGLTPCTSFGAGMAQLVGFAPSPTLYPAVPYATVYQTKAPFPLTWPHQVFDFELDCLESDVLMAPTGSNQSTRSLLTTLPPLATDPFYATTVYAPVWRRCALRNNQLATIGFRLVDQAGTTLLQTVPAFVLDLVFRWQ